MKLHGPAKWTYYHLYAVIDIYSRYVVGWTVADRESSELATTLMRATVEKQGVDPVKYLYDSDGIQWYVNPALGKRRPKFSYAFLPLLAALKASSGVAIPELIVAAFEGQESGFPAPTPSTTPIIDGRNIESTPPGQLHGFGPLQYTPGPPNPNATGVCATAGPALHDENISTQCALNWDLGPCYKHYASNLTELATCYNAGSANAPYPSRASTTTWPKEGPLLYSTSWLRQSAVVNSVLQECSL